MERGAHVLVLWRTQNTRIEMHAQMQTNFLRLDVSAQTV